MENNKNHIDNFLSDKMQDLQFDLKEEHWKDAERRLDEKDDKKKPFFLLFIVGFLLLGLGTAAYKVFSPSKKSTPIVTNQYNKDENQQEQNVQTNYANGEAVSGSTIESKDNSTVEEDNSVKQVAKNEAIEVRYNKDKQSAANAASLNADFISNEQKPSTAKKTKRKSKKQVVAKRDNLNSQKQKRTKASSDKLTKANSKSKSDLVKSKDTKGSKTNAFDNKKNNPITLVKSNSTNNTSDNKKEQLGSPAAVKMQSQAPVETARKIRIYKTPEEYRKLNPRYVDGLEGYTYSVDKIKLTSRQSDSIRNIVAMQNAPVTPAVVEKEKEKQVFEQKPSSIFILAGLAAARGYVGNSNGNASYGLSPSLGLGYQYNFTKRMSLYLSLYMSYLNHLNIKETSTNVTYSFDKDSTLISVTRKNLLQMHIPLQLAYKLSHKHSIYGGLGINFGLNTVSLYEDSKQSAASRKFGYTNGLRFMDVNASFGYEYMISPQLSLGLFYQQGLFDMTKNNYFNNLQMDRNSRGGIRLRYKFIR